MLFFFIKMIHALNIGALNQYNFFYLNLRLKHTFRVMFSISFFFLVGGGDWVKLKLYRNSKLRSLLRLNPEGQIKALLKFNVAFTIKTQSLT